MRFEIMNKYHKIYGVNLLECNYYISTGDQRVYLFSKSENLDFNRRILSHCKVQYSKVTLSLISILSQYTDWISRMIFIY